MPITRDVVFVASALVRGGLEAVF